MERETSTIITPIGHHEVILKSWLTGRERRALTNVFLKDAEIQQHGATPTFSGLKGTIIAEAEDLTLNTVIISIDGDEKNLANRVLDMHSEDTAFVIAAINSITQEIELEKKD